MKSSEFKTQVVSTLHYCAPREELKQLMKYYIKWEVELR